MLDLPKIRSEFPLLEKAKGGHATIYLDSAATAQKPKAVLKAMDHYYLTHNANVHRGMHILAEEATEAYEASRKVVQHFLNAQYPSEIVFVKSCTEGLNLVAKSFRKMALRTGDRVLLTLLEHHSNVVPWLQLKEEYGIEVEWVGIDNRGNLNRTDLQRHLRSGKVKILSITGQSNVLGVRPPLQEIIKEAHRAGALVCIDAAQLVAHTPIDVEELDCDFLTFSGHKIYGPTGVGVLYGKKEYLEKMPAFLGGGGMIREVYQDHFTEADIPQKFEAGTPPIAEAIGLATALKWMGQFRWDDIVLHEFGLLTHALEELRKVQGLRILGPGDPEEIVGCISFDVAGIHPHDLTEIVGRQGICLRAGHHCTQPLHQRLGLTASTRLSIGIYNTLDEISILPTAIEEAQHKILGTGRKTKTARSTKSTME